MKLRLAFAVLLAFAAGSPAFSSEKESDALEALKAHIANIRGTHTETGEVRSVVWTAISFDAWRTESIVTPYHGTIETTRMEIENDVASKKPRRFVARLAYRDDQWQLVELHVTTKSLAVLEKAERGDADWAMFTAALQMGCPQQPLSPTE